MLITTFPSLPSQNLPRVWICSGVDTSGAHVHPATARAKISTSVATSTDHAIDVDAKGTTTFPQYTFAPSVNKTLPAFPHWLGSAHVIETAKSI